MKFRVVTTDTVTEDALLGNEEELYRVEAGTPLVTHHDSFDTFEEARIHAELIAADHEIVSVYRIELDEFGRQRDEGELLWSNREE
jgi:hypothetical protein